MRNHEKINLFLLISLAGLLSVAVCLFLYYFDNKYTVSCPQAKSGVLQLTEQALEDHPVLFLVDGWGYFDGRLLSPADFNVSSPLPDDYIFIGQYGGFEAGDLSADPHGSASYHLRLSFPDNKREFLLEVPEIFSAYRLYIDGELKLTMGDPNPENYFPETKNQTVRFETSGETDILIAVSDFSHLYSGMVYPPALGVPESVSSLLNARLALRTAICSFAAVIGLLSLFIGITSKKFTTALLYGLLCLFFIGYAGYPIWKTFCPGFYPFYSFESVSFCGMLATVVWIHAKMTGQTGKGSRTLILFGGAVGLFAAVLPLLLPSGSLKMMAAFSFLVMLYQWTVAICITITAIWTSSKGSVSSKMILCGVLGFDAGLIMERLLPWYEPIVTGWFPEIFSFVLVICIGLAVSRDLALKYRDSTVLEERANSMEWKTKMQQANYDLLLENMAETRAIRHDIRHHFAMINEYLQNREYEKLLAYMAEYQAVFHMSQPAAYCQNDVINVLVHRYAHMAEEAQVDFTTRLEVERDVAVASADLCAILSNLLENGLEACQRQTSGKRFLSLSIGQKLSLFSIHMENSTDGNVCFWDGAYPSSKAPKRKGYGLESVRAIARRYGGEAEFVCNNSERMFCSTVYLPLAVSTHEQSGHIFE